MKTLNIIFASMISATLMVSISNTALAHSEHDRTPLPLSWTFNDSVREKISRAMKDEAHMGLVGLSHHEQTVLERYGIRVDQSFYTPVNGGQALVQRTQAGLKILESTTPVSSEFRWQAPVIKKSRVVQSSTPAMNHPGHHHRHLSLSLRFDHKVTEKMERHLNTGTYPMKVGLSSTEQRIVDSYGIQTGNSFITPVRGEDYLVKRVSSGLQIMQKVMDPTPVAVQPVAVDTAQFKG